MNNKTILIADDHELIRSGLRHVLSSGMPADSPFQIAEASNGEQALDVIRSMRPVLAILDIEMPLMSGFDVARKVYDEGLSVDIVFLTMFNDEALFNRAMDIGVKGYILKENTGAELMQCVRTVLDGRYYLSPELTDFLLRRNSRAIRPASDKDGLSLLTPTEKTVLRSLASMKTSQEIAAELGVSVKTVQNHRSNICDKLGLQGSHALLRFAVDQAMRL